jgi:hypothetical protein
VKVGEGVEVVILGWLAKVVIGSLVLSFSRHHSNQQLTINVLQRRFFKRHDFPMAEKRNSQLVQWVYFLHIPCMPSFWFYCSYLEAGLWTRLALNSTRLESHQQTRTGGWMPISINLFSPIRQHHFVNAAHR